MKEKLYLFNWVGGGYNTVRAKTRRGVLKAVKKKFPNCMLVVDERTIRVAERGDVDAEDRYWGPYD